MTLSPSLFFNQPSGGWENECLWLWSQPEVHKKFQASQGYLVRLSQNKNSNNKNTRKNKTEKVGVRLNRQSACLQCKKLRVQSPDKKVPACNTSTQGVGGEGAGRVGLRGEKGKKRQWKKERKRKKTSGRKGTRKENDKLLFLTLNEWLPCPSFVPCSSSKSFSAGTSVLPQGKDTNAVRNTLEAEKISTKVKGNIKKEKRLNFSK